MKLTATGYNTNGEAIATYNNKVFYVPGLINGEIAICEIETEKEKWGRARIKEIIESSPNRNKDVPKNHLQIGGYEIMHMNRTEQTAFKNSKVIDDFKRNAKHDIKLEPMFIGEKQFRYRNKITLHDGGFHKRGTNQVLKMKDFLLTDIKPVTERPGNVIIRKLDTTIEGYKSEPKFTTDTMMGIQFTIALGAFYQVNKEIAEAVYKEMMLFIEPNEIIFDLYSGIGTISLIVSKTSKEVYGVERDKISHKSADFNKTANKVNNVTFVNQEVIDFLKETDVKPDTIIVDPAREGLGKEVCEALNDIQPNRIIYLSCNPGTQAADFMRLKDNYNIIHARTYDMFPQTHHIENLIILNKK